MRLIGIPRTDRNLVAARASRAATWLPADRGSAESTLRMGRVIALLRQRSLSIVLAVSPAQNEL
jgi:hypothetical protein